MSLTLAERGFAMGEELIGNKPLNELNYTEWRGIMPIVNDKSRVYQVWVNGNENLYYKGDTTQLNTALAVFAKMEVKNHVVVLRPGPAERHSFKKVSIPFNWEVHLLSGIAKHKATDDIEDLEWQKDPVLTIYVGGDIDLDKIELPNGVTLRAAPAVNPEAEKNENAKRQIDKFLARRAQQNKSR